MNATDAYRRLRREVHDVLEVGGDAHPMGRVVNGFIITLIFLNANTFAADTVPELAERYGWEFKAFNVFSVIVFHHRIRAQGVERRGDSDAEPAAARAGEASLCDEADDDHRPARLRALCTGFIRSISGSSGYSGCFACSCSWATRQRCRRSAASLPMNIARCSARCS